MRTTSAHGRKHRDNARGDAADWRLARHDFHLATAGDARNEPRPYPIAVPRNGPEPTDPAAAPFLPLASPRPAASEQLSTATALEVFGFKRLQQAVLACKRRERERPRTTGEERGRAEAVVARIERLAASLGANAAGVIEVSFDSPRGLTNAAAGGAAPRIRLRIGGRPGNGQNAVPLTLDVDPHDPLVNPQVTDGGRRVDVAPPVLGRLARIAATDRTGFRPPAPDAQTLLEAARAFLRAGSHAVRVTTRAVDEAIEERVETCGQETLARLLLARCWPRLTPNDPDNAWVMHLSKRSSEANAQQTTLARYDRAASSIVVDDQRLDTQDDKAVTALIAAVRTAGHAAGDLYWTHHRTQYPSGFERTTP